MSGNFAIMLMSHGNFAKSAIESAELIVGEQTNYDTLSVFVAEQMDDLRQEMFKKIDELDTSKGLLVLTDIIGGTPMNLAGNLLDRTDTLICSGLNLPILLEILMNRANNFDNLSEIIENAYTQGLVLRTKDSLGKEDEDNDLL